MSAKPLIPGGGFPLTPEGKFPPPSTLENYPTSHTTSSSILPPLGQLPPLNPPTSNCNDDLTSLSWLQSLDMGGVVPHLTAPPTPPASPQSELMTEHKRGLPKVELEPPAPEKIDYSIDGSVKPPFSYAALIGMAMKENGHKMTLSAIYKWIKDNFAYYKTADPSWQNSIRHNLSLNKCFLKVPRSKDEPGKGGFWRLDPEYAETLVDGVFKKRRPSKGTSPPVTKSKKNRRSLTYTQQQQIRDQVQKQRQKDADELQRQREQDEAVRSLLEPQSAYMPPPSTKPPLGESIFMDQPEPMSTILVDDTPNVRDDFVLSTLLEEGVQDDPWHCSTQEVITDLTQSGDPSTYQISASPTPSLSCTSPSIGTPYQQSMQLQHQHAQSLPSFELSPQSLGVEEDLFEYSETSADESDSLISSFDLGVGLDLAVSTTPWEAKSSCQLNYNMVDNFEKEICIGQKSIQLTEEDSELIQLTDIEGNLTQLTPLEPVTPIVVQEINNPTAAWAHEQQWDEAKTMSILEANLDFDKLIDLDVL